MTQPTGLTIDGQQITTDPDIFRDVLRYLIVAPGKQADPAFDALQPGKPSALIDPMRQQIVTAMQAQGSPVVFARLSDAIDNIELRLAAMRVFDAFNTGDYDADYFSETIKLKSVMGWFVSQGQTQSPSWALIDPADPYSAQFVERSTNSPADIFAPEIGNIFPFRGECAGAFQMAVYLGLLNGLGPGTFDTLAAKFGTMYVGPWRTGPDRTPNPAMLFMEKADLADPPIPGDYMYFKNKDDYLTWAPDGFWTGLNAMYMGADALGTGHWSGMGAAWLSEVNLRASLVNAYYHDCSPHTIDDPETEVRFTLRYRLGLPATLAAGTSDRGSGKAARLPLSTPMIAAAGLTPAGDGLHRGENLTLGALGAALGFHPDELRQVASAPIENPPHAVALPGGKLTVHYADDSVHRTDPETRVTAHLSLDTDT